MTIIDENNLDEYVDSEDLLTHRKYGSAIYLPKGMAIYLPTGSGTTGSGFTDFISGAAKFLVDNKEAISAGVDAASKVAKLGIDISKGAEEIENVKALRANKTTKSKGGSLENSLYPDYNWSSKNSKEDQAVAERIANASENVSGGSFQILK